MSNIIGRKLEIQESEKLQMVTTYGITYGKHSGMVQRQVVMDDLFMLH